MGKFPPYRYGHKCQDYKTDGLFQIPVHTTPPFITIRTTPITVTAVSKANSVPEAMRRYLMAFDMAG